MTQFSRHRAPTAGFTLVEALVALLVMAFGMLALAGFQSSLSTAAENAKQRSEAVRLAQQKLEELRAFQQTAASVSAFDYATDVVSGGPETLSKAGAGATLYNTANPYTRQWWVTNAGGVTAAGPADAQKWLRVAVSWIDRAGQTQTVTLQSVVARADPADLGTLGTGPGVTKGRTPKNRSVDIPYPAKQLTGGKSSFQPPGSTFTYVFDNVSGLVVGRCTGTLNTGDTFDPGGSNAAACAYFDAYLLSGYVRFLTSIPSSGNAKLYDQGISDPNVATKEMTAAMLMNAIGYAGTPATPYCPTQRRKVVSANNVQSSAIASNGAVRSSNVVTITTQRNVNLSVGQVVSINDVTDPTFNGQFIVASVINQKNFTYAQNGPAASSTGGTATLIQQLTIAESEPTPPGYDTVNSRFVAYTCIIEPWDHDNDEQSTPAPPQPTARRWWGQFVITPQPTTGDSTDWSLGAAAGTNVWQVCRFSGDYLIDDKMSNSEHPLHYRGVAGTIDNQNYLVIPAGLSCPTDVKVDPLNDNYINVNTVLHQTAAGTAAGGQPSESSSQWATTPEPSSAPSSITDVLPMF